MWKYYARNNARGACFLAVIILGGCVSPTWEAVKGPLQEDDLKVVIDLPEGWHRFRDSSGDIILTKYGLALQNIRISRKPLSELNKDAKKPLASSALPHEVVHWFGEQFLASPRLMNQQILETNMATVAGHPGYQVRVTFRNADGLKYQLLQYGFLHDDAVTRLTYEAVAQDYYDRDLPAFEQLRASFREVEASKDKTAGKT